MISTAIRQGGKIKHPRPLFAFAALAIAIISLLTLLVVNLTDFATGGSGTGATEDSTPTATSVLSVTSAPTEETTVPSALVATTAPPTTATPAPPTTATPAPPATATPPAAAVAATTVPEPGVCDLDDDAVRDLPDEKIRAFQEEAGTGADGQWGRRSEAARDAHCLETWVGRGEMKNVPPPEFSLRGHAHGLYLEITGKVRNVYRYEYRFAADRNALEGARRSDVRSRYHEWRENVRVETGGTYWVEVRSCDDDSCSKIWGRKSVRVSK